MPAVTELSFKVNRKFNCNQCHKSWRYSVYLPRVDGSCDGHTTVRYLLQRSLHAAAVAMYGNIGLEDLDLTPHQELLLKWAKDCQGEKILECKTDPRENTCPDCLYASEPHLLRQSINSCDIGGILKESLRSTRAGQPESVRYTPDFSKEEVKTLDENANEGPGDKASGPPTPAPRLSRSTTGSTTTLEETKVPNIVVPSAYLSMSKFTGGITSQDTMTTTLPQTRPLPSPPDDNDYETPIPTLTRPSLPPIPEKLHIFNHDTPAGLIRSALYYYEQFNQIRNMYAILELKYNSSGKMESPYMLISNRLENTQRAVLRKPTGEFWIHRGKCFDTMKDLLSYYKIHPTKSGAVFQNPLTLTSLKSFVEMQRSARPPVNQFGTRRSH